jgi:hypothetical protein
MLDIWLYIASRGIMIINIYWLTINIKNMKITKTLKDPSYIFCHKIIPFIRPPKLNVIQFYSTISNYLYHEDIYSAKLHNNYIESAYITPQTIVHSFVNSIVSVSLIKPCYYKYSIPVHIIKFVYQYDDIIPIGVDTCFYFSVDAIIIYYIYVLFKQLKPFYNLNPLVLHVLLIVIRQYSNV